MSGSIAWGPVDGRATAEPRPLPASALLVDQALGILSLALRWCLSRGVAYALHGATFAP